MCTIVFIDFIDYDYFFAYWIESYILYCEPNRLIKQIHQHSPWVMHNIDMYIYTIIIESLDFSTYRVHHSFKITTPFWERKSVMEATMTNSGLSGGGWGRREGGNYYVLQYNYFVVLFFCFYCTIPSTKHHDF